MHRPLHSLLFLALVFGTLALTSWLFPGKGLHLWGDISLRFIAISEFWQEEEKAPDISSIISRADELDRQDTITVLPADSVLSVDSVPPAVPVPMVATLITSLQYQDPKALESFFRALTSVKTATESVRVLHFGDSQIEGDRITDYLRSKLQGRFGGAGPGLMALIPITQRIYNKVHVSDGWDNYSVYLGKDKRVKHGNYGIRADFSRYIPYRQLSDTSKPVTASFTVSASKSAGASGLDYSRIRLFYGGAQRRTACRLYEGPALIAADSLQAGGNFNVKEFVVHGALAPQVFKFRGFDSPDFYGISLESGTGVMVDNIAQRGSSGTFFHHISSAQLKQFCDYLNVKLIILQYGGNALPSIEDAEMAANYASYIRGQISILKRLAPGASIIFVGPSDMSIKSGTSYVTYPLLETLRNELKKVVLESGCAFFDLYDCMGGRNSMRSWVAEKLAASDYTHFSPQGARKIATLFYTALINEFNAYSAKKKA